MTTIAFLRPTLVRPMSVADIKANRYPDTAVSVGIVYGSCAFFLGKKAHETATHKWTLFVRGPNDEDLSTILSKVAFSLHESFAEPVRIIDKPPFEVTELGWGEFAAKIRLFFKDPEEQPVDIVHIIKLYPQNAPNQNAAIQQGASLHQNVRKPVMSETYDEIVFAEPTMHFRQKLLSYVPRTIPAVQAAVAGPVTAGGGVSAAAEGTTATTTAATAAAANANVMADHYTVFDEEKDIIAIMGAQQHLLREIDVAKTKLAALDAEAQFLAAGVNDSDAKLS